MLAELQEKYAHLFEDELLEEMNQVATFKEIKAGDKLIDFGAYVRSMPLIVSGAIKC